MAKAMTEGLRKELSMERKLRDIEYDREESILPEVYARFVPMAKILAWCLLILYLAAGLPKFIAWEGML